MASFGRGGYGGGFHSFSGGRLRAQRGKLEPEPTDVDLDFSSSLEARRGLKQLLRVF